MNNSKLRSHVFGPVESARKERLSAKLLELASKPKPREDENIGMEHEEKGLPSHTIDPTVYIGADISNLKIPTSRNKKRQNPMIQSLLQKVRRLRSGAFHRDNADELAAPAGMDVDQVTGNNSTSRSTTRSTKRVEKRGRVKAKASMVFPVYKKGRRIGPRLTARQKKQSLKP